MAHPENSPSPAIAEPSRWTARLQRFGQRTIITVLLGVFVLWLHELFVDPDIRQGWKLKVLMVLLPLGVVGAAALLLAWLGEWKSRRTR